MKSVRPNGGSYTFGWATGAYQYPGQRPATWVPMTAEELVDTAVELAVPVCQMCVSPSLGKWNDVQVRTLRASAAERGLEIEVGTSGCDPHDLTNHLRVARALESRVVRTVLPNQSADLLDATRSIASVIPAFEEAGVILMVENHDTYSAHTLAAMLAQLSSPSARSCIDPVNSLGRGEGVREVSEVLVPYAAGLQVKDFSSVRLAASQEFRMTGAIAGQGLLDIPQIVHDVLDSDPDASIVLEQWTPVDHAIEDAVAKQRSWAEEAVSYLRSVVGGAG